MNRATKDVGISVLSHAMVKERVVRLLLGMYKTQCVAGVAPELAYERISRYLRSLSNEIKDEADKALEDEII